MRQFIFLLMLILCSFSLAAQSSRSQLGASQFYFDETFFPVYVSKNDAASPAGGASNKSVPKESGLGYDLRTTIGYIWSPVLLGLTFNLYSVKTSRATTNDYEGLSFSDSKQEFGPTVGTFLGNWRFAFTYFMSASRTVVQKYTDPTTKLVSTDETYKNKAGKGFQLAMGYDFLLGAGLSISPTLVYRSVSYSKQSYAVRTGSGTPYGSTNLQTKAIDNELKPMITMSWRF